VKALKGVCIVWLTVVLCASCATLSPERRYLGKWSGTYESETYTAQFEKDGRCILTEEDGGTDVFAGHWTVENKEITISLEGETVNGFLTPVGDLVLSEGSVSIVFRRVQ
jgi:hypothetical protein